MTHDKSKAEIEQKLYYIEDNAAGTAVFLAPPDMTTSQAIERTIKYFKALITAAEQRGKAAELRRVYQAVKDMEHAYNNGAGRTLSKGEIIKWLEFELGI